MASLLSFLYLISICFLHTNAQPATLPFQDCFSGSNVSQKLTVNTVYAQILHDQNGVGHMNITLFGQSPQEIVEYVNGSTNLATLFVSTSILTFTPSQNRSSICDPIRPPSPLPALPANATYCPIPAGPFGLSTSIPWNSDHELTTLITRVHAEDPFSNEILCVDVPTTPLRPRPGSISSVYGRAVIIFWATVSLAIAYWLVVGIARIVSAWGRGSSRGSGLWFKVESAGFILASAISGERLSTSPALLRFCTPSMRDIIFHTQWCAALAMVAVQWPTFVYPLLAQTAWASLSYNITITSHEHWNPLSVPPFNPPSNFADQISDPSSPLFIDTTVPNALFMLPPGTPHGIASFAYTVGIRPRDLFGVCLALFLTVIGATIALSLLIWLIDWFISSFAGAGGSGSTRGVTTRSPRYSTASKDILDAASGGHSPEDSRSLNGHFMLRTSPKLPLWSGKKWWKFRIDISSFHGDVLHGNLVRILVLFHLPVTIFSTYQMTLGRAHATLGSIILAALSFALFSVILPILIVIRLTMTSTNKLYDETRTLLFLGPLYNHYRHGSQLFASLLFATNLAFGITIGCGQKSGTAQAIIILVIEVISALVTSVWLPWGSGASMGLISFLFCVARIVIAVLLVILTPTISIEPGAAGWVAYGILVVLALVYLAFLLILIVKIIEALVRIVGRIGFDRSRHVVDSGLIGACGLLGCCGPRKRRSNQRHRYRAREVPRDQTSDVSSYLPPHGKFPHGGTSSTPPSTHSGPPASVLRPEHALRPYREDSDDESGFIMGAWQPFPRPGYNAVQDQAPQQQTPVNSPGFSRVGGGRAHFDSPYAIASGSTLTFPSVERGSTNTAALGPVFDEDDLPPASVSNANVARQPHANLPPGAMPAHVRTKSQTAIIEDASAFIKSPTPTAQAASVNDVPLIPLTGSIDDDESEAPKKKHWYQIRKARRHSEGDHLSKKSSTQDLEPPSTSEGPTGGRSFVVIRDRKPPGTRSSPQPGPSSYQAPTTPTSPRPRPNSFVVVRDKGLNHVR